MYFQAVSFTTLTRQINVFLAFYITYLYINLLMTSPFKHGKKLTILDLQRQTHHQLVLVDSQLTQDRKRQQHQPRLSEFVTFFMCDSALPAARKHMLKEHMLPGTSSDGQRRDRIARI